MEKEVKIHLNMKFLCFISVNILIIPQQSLIYNALLEKKQVHT